MRALLLTAGVWAGLSAAIAADEDPVSLFQRVCMGQGSFRQSLSDFAKANGWQMGALSIAPVTFAYPPFPWPAGKFPPVSVYVRNEKDSDSCGVSDHGLTMDQHLDRVRSTLGLVGPGEKASPHIMGFFWREGSDEKALQWALSSESSDYVIFGESQHGFPHIYLQRLRSSTREKP